MWKLLNSQALIRILSPKKKLTDCPIEYINCSMEWLRLLVSMLHVPWVYAYPAISKGPSAGHRARWEWLLEESTGFYWVHFIKTRKPCAPWINYARLCFSTDDWFRLPADALGYVLMLSSKSWNVFIFVAVSSLFSSFCICLQKTISA